MKYKQITGTDRKAIEILLQENYTPKIIGEKLGFNKSTITREIKSRGTPNGYFADMAQINSEMNRKKISRNASKVIHSEVRNYILEKLSRSWSPEQIAGVMKKEGFKRRVCHETIYNFIYKDEYCKREKIYQYLRNGKKKRTKWNGRRTHKSKIPARVSIHMRPQIKGKFGHWEADSVLYPNKKVINTLNELKSGYVEFRKIERKKADLTARAMIESLDGHECKTITVDNGTEFARHQVVTSVTNAPVYFCDPYSSWQRGSNENSNGLLRKYLPKKKNIDKLTQKELDEIANELNHRPRKRLNYETPYEVYKAHILSKWCTSF